VKLPTIPHRRSAPRPSRCVLRSQAIPPSRDSDLDSRGRQRRRRGPGPAGRAAAAARCRVSPDRHRLARLLTAQSRPRLRPDHFRCRARAESPPEHRSREGAPPQQLSLANHLVDGGAHERNRHITFSTPSALTRQVHLDDRQIAQVVSRPSEHLADLGQDLLSAVTVGGLLTVRQCNAQRHSGVRQCDVITGSFGNL
jgi:hypothetical protein